MAFLAKFKIIEDHLFRFDTRIYLDAYDPDIRSHCVSSIIGKNPGSAKPKKINVLDHLDLDGDGMLPNVRNRFRAAYIKNGKAIPKNSFVRVWNLFYLCNANLTEAKRVYSELNATHVCPTEIELVPSLWFGWGGDDAFLNQFKHRFLKTTHRSPFFYNYKIKKVQEKMPSVIDPVKHTQGLPKEPIEKHLSTLV